MKATYRRKYLKGRITYSYGHPGSFNPAVIANKEVRMIYGDGHEQQNWVFTKFENSCLS